MEDLHREVDKIKAVMKSNVRQALAREDNFSQLEERADRLHEASEQFYRYLI